MINISVPQAPLSARILLITILLILLITSAASARTLTLAWDPSEDPSVDRYVVYWGTRSGDYSQNSDAKGHLIPAGATTYQITDLSGSRPYFFAVKSLNALGLSSDYSDEAALPAIAGLKNDFRLAVSRHETFYLSGVAAANKPVEVYNGRIRIGSTAAGPDGAWSLAVNSSILGEGPVQLTASSTGAESEQIMGNVQVTSAPTPGDLDCLNGVDLADAVIALKVVSGISVFVSADRDATGDRRIGIPDALFILQTVSGMRGV
ncbi:MAG: fibronectin type III domain-containing protein [Thermodesulfobacteriota bacterium]